MTTLSIVLIFLVVALGALIFWLMRSNQQQLQQNFFMLRDNLDKAHQNLLVLQKEAEKAQEMKSHALRAELSQELKNNRVELQKGLSQTSQGLENKVGSIDKRLDQSLGSLSNRVQDKLELNLKEGFRHFEKIQEQLKLTATQLNDLNTVGSSITDLNNLLKLPHLRGSFGESTMERLLADLLPSHAYELQYKIVPGATERVDAVIKYPTCVLPMDCKFPREQVLPLFDSNDPIELEKARKTLEEAIRIQAKSISEKYIRPDMGTTEMALMFVPSETLYFEALKNIRLSNALSKLKVFLVSPNTLAITLHAISMARDYYEMAKGIEKTIGEVKKAEKHYQNFEKRFKELGKSIKRAQDAFDTATTHMGRYSSAVGRLVKLEPPSAVPPEQSLTESTV